MQFFTADLHLGDDDIIEREARPFKNIKEFEEAFIKNVNDVATEDDTLYVLGDYISYCNSHRPPIKEVFETAKRIKPSVILIVGNDEERVINEVYEGDIEKFRKDLEQFGIKEVYREADIELGGMSIHLVHKPTDHKDGIINLFGHNHRATGLYKPFGINVGVDLNYFRPFSEKEIIRLLEMKRDWWDKDADVNCDQ